MAANGASGRADMHPHHRAPPYRPPAFAPSDDPGALIQLPADAPPTQLADALDARLRQLAAGRDLRTLRRQARDGFRAVMRHARACRLAGLARAPFDVRRGGPAPKSGKPRRPRRHRR